MGVFTHVKFVNCISTDESITKLSPNFSSAGLSLLYYQKVSELTLHDQKCYNSLAESELKMSSIILSKGRQAQIIFK